MLTGTWTGDYIDIDGHRGTMVLQIDRDNDALSGRFRLTLATEDAAEVHEGALSGKAGDGQATLHLALPQGEPVRARLILSTPPAHAEQSAHGTLDPAPAMRLGGGVVMLWRYRD